MKRARPADSRRAVLWDALDLLHWSCSGVGEKNQRRWRDEKYRSGLIRDRYNDPFREG